MVIECAGQELNLHSPKAGGLQPLGLANAQPTHALFLATALRSLAFGASVLGC